MRRIELPADLQPRLRSFQRLKGLTDAEMGEILDFDTSDGLSLLFRIEVPRYVVDTVERLVAPERFDIVDHADAVAQTAIRFGVAEKVETMTHGRGIVLHLGYAIDDVPLKVAIRTDVYLSDTVRGDAETWRFLRTYVAGYVDACMEASTGGKSVAT